MPHKGVKVQPCSSRTIYPKYILLFQNTEPIAIPALHPAKVIDVWLKMTPAIADSRHYGLQTMSRGCPLWVDCIYLLYIYHLIILFSFFIVNTKHVSFCRINSFKNHFLSVWRNPLFSWSTILSQLLIRSTGVWGKNPAYLIQDHHQIGLKN